MKMPDMMQLHNHRCTASTRHGIVQHRAQSTVAFVQTARLSSSTGIIVIECRPTHTTAVLIFSMHRRLSISPSSIHVDIRSKCGRSARLAIPSRAGHHHRDADACVPHRSKNTRQRKSSRQSPKSTSAANVVALTLSQLDPAAALHIPQTNQP